MVDELSNKISALKRVTIAIGDDVREQNRLLNDLVIFFLQKYTIVIFKNIFLTAYF